MPKTVKNPHPASRARAERERAMRVAMRRKEEYLGARVPRALKERVIAQAAREGIPVSLLIRRTLEAAFPAADRTTSSRDTVPEASRFSAVLAWQAVEVAREGRCAACARPLQEGEDAWLAVGMDPAPTVVCVACKEALSATR